MKTKKERLAEMDWERPDWEFLYHVLLYKILDPGILDKRTHKVAHERTMAEVEFLRRATELFYTRLAKQYGVDGDGGALHMMRLLREGCDDPLDG